MDDPADHRPALRFQKSATIGDESHGPPSQPRISAQHLRSMLWLEFEIILAIEYARDYVLHVVWKAMIGRHDSVDIVRKLCVISFRSWDGSRVVSETALNHGEALVVIFRDVMGHAADRGVHPGASERFRIDALARRPSPQVRAGQPHETCPFD